MTGDGRGDTMAHDTSFEAAQLQVQLWRRMSTVEKAALVSGASITVQRLSMAGIQLRHPGASHGECRLRLALITLGRELACKVYPEARRLVGPPA